MLSPCNTCALASNRGAAKEPANRLKAMICAYGAQVFWCHHGRDGTEYDWKESPLGPMQLAPANRKPCGGWQRYVARLKARGYFSDPGFRFVRQWIGRRSLVFLELFIETKDEKLRKHYHAKLQESMRFLVARDISNLEIPL